ncbi:outer membrane protein assembly factor BamD [Candidatus Fukatsuia anoeciicola]|uniref:outer membrane protein assembly factor BamD n=1 Tax=Candidatus Fukatsuia anoeciicola TaxID=2994492 RepID=UPI003463963D
MIIRITHLAVVVILHLLLIGCSSNKYKIIEKSPTELYADAQKKLQNNNFGEAITQLEVLNNHYPFNPYSQQVYFDLIYAYYKSANLSMTQTLINRFMRLNPKHRNSDYILYMRGLTNIALDNNMLQGFFQIDRSDRDPTYALAAFYDFNELLKNYPHSQYILDSQKQLLYIANRLAKHELAIVQYYAKNKAYVAVINRIKQMLQNYPNTQATRYALPIMENAYRQLQLIKQANKVTV